MIEADKVLWEQREVEVERIVDSFYRIDELNWKDYDSGFLTSSDYERLHERSWEEVQQKIKEVTLDYRMKLIDTFKNVVVRTK